MGGFRLLAVRTGSHEISPTTFLKSKNSTTKVDWLKILKENTIYPFCSNFEYPDNDFNHIIKTKDFQNIFSIRLNDDRLFPVNAHAVVGENGSGKSTLIELIYWMNYNLGTINEHLKTDEGESYEINRSFAADFFYQAADKFYTLNFKDGLIQQSKIDFIGNKYISSSVPSFIKIFDFKDLTDFFYTVVINYSQHSLNALEIGDWIDPLFHKNDAYQTPIVINPQRFNGEISISRERTLLSRRLQSLVLEKHSGKIENSLQNLANGKIAERFDICYNQKYFEKEKSTIKQFSAKVLKEIAKNLQELFDIDFSKDDLDVLFSIEIKFNNENDLYLDKDKILKRIILTYIFCKMKKLVRVYKDYKPFATNFPNRIKAILEKVHSSDSHLVFKIKGAILHLKYFKEIYPLNILKNFSNDFSLNISEFSKIIHDKIIPNEDKYYINTFMMAMPSFWNVEVVPAENNLISHFSSGEKQKIFSISSIVYHIINLNSVEENKVTKEYKYINLVLDEIELYYHPEWQRRFLQDLLTYMRKINPLNLKNIQGINILFVTHSPFILSDIPSDDILRLSIDKDGKTKADNQPRPTFGANIHDLLANDFFLRQGFMGEFAKTKINEMIDDLKNSIDRKVELSKNRYLEIENLINLIGEPILKNSLNSLYISANPQRKDDFIDLQLKMLEKLKSKK